MNDGSYPWGEDRKVLVYVNGVEEPKKRDRLEGGIRDEAGRWCGSLERWSANVMRGVEQRGRFILLCAEGPSYRGKGERDGNFLIRGITELFIQPK